jgi:hypothetical protein
MRWWWEFISGVLIVCVVALAIAALIVWINL